MIGNRVPGKTANRIRMHSSRMRTACSLPYRGEGSLSRGVSVREGGLITAHNEVVGGNEDIDAMAGTGHCMLLRDREQQIIPR